jgi:DNA helicase-2/ATP-dependent DNA helicase PcrA
MSTQKELEEVFRDLNPPQREAVQHTDGPLLILAGAGSGKTRVITHRIARLLRQGVSPDSVLAITFTNKAAGEMKERTERLCRLRSGWISTFHSLAARILRRHIYRLEPYDTSFTICDRDDCRALVKFLLKSEGIDQQLWEPSTVIAEISRVKSSLEGDEELLGSDYRHGQVLRTLYLKYTELMRQRNLLDFDDLLLLLVRLFREHDDVLERYRDQFRYVLVDEYQDTNAIQYRITRLLAAHGNLCITGDPDQSIYAWRGADITNILNFEHDYPGALVVKLEQNYRSTGNVLKTANALISRNTERKPKDLWTENEDGDPVRVYRFETETEEAREVATVINGFLEEGLSCGDIAIFYRMNSLSRTIEQELIYGNIPYSIVGGIEFFLRKEVKDVLSFVRVLANPRDSESLKRIINVPPRGVGKGTIEKLEEVAQGHRRGLLDVVLHEEFDDDFTSRQRKALTTFRALYERLSELKEESVETLLTGIIETTGYEAHLVQSNSEDAADRQANLSELVGAAVEYDQAHPDGSLAGFLELTALLGDVDRWERSDERVSLMTLHSAKGLEFPVVIIVGVEDGILPLIRAGDVEPNIEEERRLLYVGNTRAMKRLYLTHTKTRMRFGQTMRSAPSRFLRELAPPGEDAWDTLEQLSMDAATEESLHGPSQTSRRLWEEYDTESGADSFGDTDASDPFADDFPVDEDPYPEGARVWHDDYGEGDVLGASGVGERRRVTVRFDEAGEKQFVVSYAPLRRVR